MKNLALITALLLISATGFGQKANFSGSWTLNNEKSDLGDQFSFAPKSMTVEHAKKTLDVERNYMFQGKESQTKDHFTLDGKVCENSGWRETIIKSTATWDRKTKTITINSKAPMQDGSEANMSKNAPPLVRNLVIEKPASSPTLLSAANAAMSMSTRNT